MVTPQEAVDTIIYTFQEAPVMSNDLTYLNRAADQSGADANIKLPVIEAEILTVSNMNDFTSDVVGFTYNNDGQQDGRIYHDEYSMMLQLDIYVAQNSNNDVQEMAENMQTVLYKYDSSGPGDTFIDESGNSVDSIWSLQVRDGTRRDDMTQTPTLRRWSQELEINAYVEYTTEESPITSASYPSQGSDIT